MIQIPATVFHGIFVASQSFPQHSIWQLIDPLSFLPFKVNLTYLPHRVGPSPSFQPAVLRMIYPMKVHPCLPRLLYSLPVMWYYGSHWIQALSGYPACMLNKRL